MTLVVDKIENAEKEESNPNKITTGKKVKVSTRANSNENNFKADLKEALNDAFDIIEGKKLRKSLTDILNG